MVSVNEILSDVLRSVDDEAMKKFSRGYYTSMIQQALELLDFNTYMNKRMEQFDYAPFIPMPENAWNIREIYLFNGDCCDVMTAQNVWWKRNYKGNNANRVTKDTNDHFIKSFSDQDNIYYYNVFDGNIYLSPACADYSRVLIVFNGISTPIGTTPIVPIQLRKTVCDIVTMEVFKKLKARISDIKAAQYYRQLYADAYNELYNKQTGSWWTAINFATSMDSHSRQSLLEYLSKAND